MKWGNTAEDVLETIKENRAYDNIAVVLSGGMDSATCLAISKALQPEKIIGLAFDYGQRHDKEIQFARKLGFEMGIDVRTINISSLAGYFRTALRKDSDIAVPDHAVQGVIPPTYVPFRNTIFLSIALGYAESWGYKSVFYGANIVDYSGYPDCRPEYIQAMNHVVYAHEKRIEVEAPVLYLTKGEIVKLGTELKVPWEHTWSCYRGEQLACGKCPSCEYRLKGFSEAGIMDPIAYATEEKQSDINDIPKSTSSLTSSSSTTSSSSILPELSPKEGFEVHDDKGDVIHYHPG